MFFGPLVYLLIGGVVQLFFELVWRHERLATYPPMWPVVLVGVLLWPLAVLSLMLWLLTLARRRRAAVAEVRGPV